MEGIKTLSDPVTEEAVLATSLIHSLKSTDEGSSQDSRPRPQKTTTPSTLSAGN